MRTATDWLEEGMLLLSSGGLPALRIDALAARVGLTKGSFYHHFVDLADYRRALLAHYETRCTAVHIQANKRLNTLPAADRLSALSEAVLTDAASHRGLDVAIRGWAAQDDDARDTVERIDLLRLSYLQQIFAEQTDAALARTYAHTAYLIFIGAQHLMPPASAVDVRRAWDRLLEQLRAEAAP